MGGTQAVQAGEAVQERRPANNLPRSGLRLIKTLQFVGEFNSERPHEALQMRCPGQLYSPFARPDRRLPEVAYRLQDGERLEIACERSCMHCKKVNTSSVMAGQRLGIKEIDDAIWLVSFMHYDLGYIDLEQRTLQTIDNPFCARL